MRPVPPPDLCGPHSQGGQEQSNPAMMSMGMMWPPQQQMPVSPGQMPDGQFAQQQHYGAQPIH